MKQRLPFLLMLLLLAILLLIPVLFPVAPAPPPPPLSHFGVEVNRGHVERTIHLANAADVAWVRYNGILWSEVESTPGVRDWSKIAKVETELRTLSSHGIQPVVIVRGTPAWAQHILGKECGPIKPDALDAFADFMHDLVARYSVPPYNVHYWEIWNEPDVDPALVPSTNPYGCWGNSDDPWYGGAYFATMLQRVYPAIKKATPNVHVIHGGLMLDCDPTNPLAEKDCSPGRFLEGVLRNGGGESFDMLAFHSYAFWDNTTHDWELDHPDWQHRGGAIRGRLSYLRTIMHTYDIDKPLLLNEGGLLCHTTNTACFKADFLDAQAHYATRFYVRAWASGIQGAAWYSLNDTGWNESGLMGGRTPRPSYYAFKYIANTLTNASYIGTIAMGNLEGYTFRKENKWYDIYWTNDGSRRILRLPSGTRAVYNHFGHGITPRGDMVTVGFAPIVIER